VADRVGAAPEWVLSIAGLLAVGAAVGIATARKRRSTRTD
jgi:apolipoprotein N-acyltransferase